MWGARVASDADPEPWFDSELIEETSISQKAVKLACVLADYFASHTLRQMT
jgi:hypothetical protein